jgi:hypothetical protein
MAPNMGNARASTGKDSPQHDPFNDPFFKRAGFGEAFPMGSKRAEEFFKQDSFEQKFPTDSFSKSTSTCTTGQLSIDPSTIFLSCSHS